VRSINPLQISTSSKTHRFMRMVKPVRSIKPLQISTSSNLTGLDLAALKTFECLQAPYNFEMHYRPHRLMRTFKPVRSKTHSNFNFFQDLTGLDLPLKTFEVCKHSKNSKSTIDLTGLKPNLRQNRHIITAILDAILFHFNNSATFSHH
jgi:hypothetical protein